MSDSAQNKIPYVPQDTLDPAAGLNDAIRVIDALLNTRVENMTTDAPPGSPADGVCYIVGNAPTGAWAGHANALATYVADGAFWTFYEAGAQAWLVLNKDDSNLYKWDVSGNAWILAAGIGDAPTDGELYGRKNNTWIQMPDVTQAVLSVNDATPDSSGNVEIEMPVGDVRAVNGHTPDSNGDVLLVLQRLAGINDQTGSSYTLVLSDVGRDIRCTRATAIVLIVPQESTSTPWQQGDLIIFSQGGAGAVTAQAGSSHVMLQAANGMATTALYDARVLEYLGSDTWRVW